MCFCRAFCDVEKQIFMVWNKWDAHPGRIPFQIYYFHLHVHGHVVGDLIRDFSDSNPAERSEVPFETRIDGKLFTFSGCGSVEIKQ